MAAVRNRASSFPFRPQELPTSSSLPPLRTPRCRGLNNALRLEADINCNDSRTIARSFSQELGDIFRIENSIADLDEKVDKRSVDSQLPARGLLLTSGMRVQKANHQQPYL